MFYPESKKEFFKEVFKNPGKNYRATPFWAWNTKLDKEELKRQIEVFKEMGFGGFHIHSRVGMATPYLSKDFFSLVKVCNKKGKQEDMLTYLYDEDRWPSGAAGGFVTQHEEYRQMYLKFRTTPIEDSVPVAIYDLKFNLDNTFVYKKRESEDLVENEIWYAYVEREPAGNGWFNNQCYVDVLSKKAIAKFLDVTHNAYKENLQKEFSKSIPSIFTDEPQYTRVNVFDHNNDNFMLPWTDGFDKMYLEKYGADIFETLPEIFFEKKGDYSQTRYNYYDLVAQTFAENFFDQYGKWCDDNNIAMTGHVLGEQSLLSQTLSVGDAMRDYVGFTMPGIDMLMNGYEFTTAKQVQSVSRQKGAEGVLCELDGVTNWDFDFRGHKLHGDWQAALGVTLRVPHLSWVSMNGEAKRDYPASINYQAAWYKKYHLIEDYFARVNSILTRGKADVKVAVLHPIRNLWLTLGTYDNTHLKVEEICKEFSKLTERLVKNHIDFDFVSESNFEKQNVHFANGKFVVDKMEYDVLIIPEMLTLKSTTVEVLKTVKEQKGRVIAFGNSPKYMDGKRSIVPNELYKLFETKPYGIEKIVDAIEEYRDYGIRENGVLVNDYCAQMRVDGDDKWLFIAKAVQADREDLSMRKLTVKIKGEYVPSLYNCENGEVYSVKYSVEDGFTNVYLEVFAQDSIMLRLAKVLDDEKCEPLNKTVDFTTPVQDENKYTLCDDNVYLIDRASFKLDDGEFEEVCDILRKDNELCGRIGIKQRGEGAAQPWVNSKKNKPTHKITLKCEFTSKIRYKDAVLAIENAKDCTITFNKKLVDNTAIGWYVDKCIDKVALGVIKKGVNTLIVEMPFGESTYTEYMYILGKFGVYDAENPYIDKLPKTLKFGDISSQGLLFYGDNLEYHLKGVSGERLHIPSYKGGLVEVLSGEERLGEIIYSPYVVDISGKKDITLKFYGTRINTFGQLHNTLHDKYGWFGSQSWRTYGDEWTDKYLPWEQGILKTPMIK
ncbi:MAG: hypothetical protein IJD90_03595 [Clostridia bacterium]|nr:hypothetical protein [Clostridia bacterium]